ALGGPSQPRFAGLGLPLRYFIKPPFRDTLYIGVEKLTGKEARRRRCVAWVVRHRTWTRGSDLQPVALPSGYCWSTSQCRNWCLAYAMVEGSATWTIRSRNSTRVAWGEDGQ